jgi:hypothetical protein
MRKVRAVRGMRIMATVIHEGPDQSGTNGVLIAVVVLIVVGLLVFMFFWFNGYMGGPQIITILQPPVQGTPGTPGAPGAPGAGGAGGAAGAPGAPGSSVTTP